MLGMLGALVIIWIGFHLLSGGLFLTPRNLWNLSVQSASIAVMSTGMVLVIVTRNIDLSVGSLLGFIGMIVGVTPGAVPARTAGFRASHDMGAGACRRHYRGSHCRWIAGLHHRLSRRALPLS